MNKTNYDSTVSTSALSGVTSSNLGIPHMSERFPKYHDIPLQYLTPAVKRAVVDKFMKEFKHTPYRYASAKNYKTYPSRSLWKKEGDKIVFTREKWYEHINGSNPRAIHVVHYSDYEWSKQNKKSDSYEYKVTTNWLLFDIDIISPPVCELVTIFLSKVLDKLGFAHHIYYSGGKGTHILVLFKEEIPIKACKDFRLYILHDCGIAELYKDAPKPPKGQNDVEIRPYGGWCAKMPLTRHGKTGNFTGPLTIDGDSLKEYDGDPYQYFLNMKFCNSLDLIMTIHKMAEKKRYEDKLELGKIQDITNQQCSVKRQAIKRVKKIPSNNQTKETEDNQRIFHLTRTINEMEFILQNGRLRKNEGRYATTLSLASYLKAKGNDDKAVIKIIEEWSHRLYQNEQPNIKTPFAEHIEIIPQIVHNAEAWYLPRSPLITSSSKIKHLASFFATNDKFFPFPTFKLALALNVYAQTKRFSVNKPFRVAILYLRKWLSMSPNSLVKARDELIEMGLLLEIEAPIERNSHKNQSGKQGKYQLTVNLSDDKNGEETIMLNMESLKEKEAEKALLVMVVDDEEELAQLMGGQKHKRRAKAIYSKHHMN